MEALNRKGHEYYSKMPKHLRKRWSEGRKQYQAILSESEFLEKTFYDHRDFILTSFRWNGTEEGATFWDKVSYGHFEDFENPNKPKTTIAGTLTFIALLFLLLGFYALIWSAFFRKDSPIRKATGQKFVEVTVWEKPDTLYMIYANKNYKADE